MLHVICDICKKHIPGAHTSYAWDKRETNYRVVLDKAICVTCMDKFDETLRDNMTQKAEFGFLDHNRILKSTLEELCQ